MATDTAAVSHLQSHASLTVCFPLVQFIYADQQPHQHNTPITGKSPDKTHTGRLISLQWQTASCEIFYKIMHQAVTLNSKLTAHWQTNQDVFTVQDQSLYVFGPKRRIPKIHYSCCSSCCYQFSSVQTKAFLIRSGAQ